MQKHYCLECGEQVFKTVVEDEQFCKNCGTYFTEETFMIPCPSCGDLYDGEMCHWCGRIETEGVIKYEIETTHDRYVNPDEWGIYNYTYEVSLHAYATPFIVHADCASDAVQMACDYVYENGEEEFFFLGWEEKQELEEMGEKFIKAGRRGLFYICEDNILVKRIDFLNEVKVINSKGETQAEYAHPEMGELRYVVNPEEVQEYDKVYSIRLSRFGVQHLVYARDRQDAIDKLINFFYANEVPGVLFSYDEGVELEEVGLHEKYVCGGAFKMYLTAEQVYIKEISRERVYNV